MAFAYHWTSQSVPTLRPIIKIAIDACFHYGRICSGTHRRFSVPRVGPGNEGGDLEEGLRDENDFRSVQDTLVSVTLSPSEYVFVQFREIMNTIKVITIFYDTG